jgi:hypothetical protein
MGRISIATKARRQSMTKSNAVLASTSRAGSSPQGIAAPMACSTTP